MKILCITVLISCLFWTAGSYAEDNEKPVYSITFPGIPASYVLEYPAYKSWVNSHPEVIPKKFTNLNIQTLRRGTLLMSIAGGIAPDFLRVFHHELKSWIRNGFFLPLDKYIYRDVDGNGKYTEGVDEVIWKPFLAMPHWMRNAIMEDGHIYVLPCFQWVQFLIYRKDLFRAAGLDPEKRINNFDDFVYVCRKLSLTQNRNRKGYALLPNGWLWQGFLYAFGGSAVKYLKTCPACGTKNTFTQQQENWQCSKCHKNLRDVPGTERAAFNSPEGCKALKLWHDMLWAPFCKCPHCGEPVSLGDARTKLTFPVKAHCPFCKHDFTVNGKNEVVTGCAAACIDNDANWAKLWSEGKVAMVLYYTTDWLINSTVNPADVGIMPLPGKGGASAFHYYGIYKGCEKRPGGEARVKACADLIMDYASQFYAPAGSPGYMKYEKEKMKYLVDRGLFNLCSYDMLSAAGLQEYAKEISPSSRKMQRMIYDPKHYTMLPVSEGYNRVQQEVLSQVLLSGIATSPHFDIKENMNKAEKLANTQVFMKDKMIGELKRKLGFVFWIVVVVALALLVGIVRIIYKVSAKSVRPEKRQLFSKKIGALALLLPAVILILTWAYYPLVRGSLMAFQNVKVLDKSEFVGIENFIRVVTNPMFTSMLKSTLIYVMAVVILGFPLPVLLAIMLSEIKRFTTFFRVIFFVPSVLGGVIILFIWRIFYMPTSEGLLNWLISFIGLGPYRWLENPAINKWMLVLPGIWAGTGAACLIYLAALKSIDQEMYESAEIDGAGIFAKIIHITLPSLKPILIINFVGVFIGAFHGMANILVMTGGAFETNVVGLQIFMEAFGYLRFGVATALAWMLGSLLIGFTVYQLNFLKKVEFRRAN